MDPHRHFAPHHPLHMRAMAGNHRDPFGRIIPNSLSSLSTGQPFYTVESLEGATSLPLLPKHPLSPADRESLPQNRARVGFAGRSSFPETRVLCAQHLHNLHSLDRIQNLRYFDYANEHRPASIENRQKLETLGRIQSLDSLNLHHRERNEHMTVPMQNLQNIKILKNRENLQRRGLRDQRPIPMENVQNLYSVKRLLNPQNPESGYLHRQGPGEDHRHRHHQDTHVFSSDHRHHQDTHVFSSAQVNSVMTLSGSHLEHPLFDQDGEHKKVLTARIPIGPQSRKLKFQKHSQPPKLISTPQFVVRKKHEKKQIEPQTASKERAVAMPNNKRLNDAKSKEDKEEAKGSEKRRKRAKVEEYSLKCEICNVTCRSQQT